MTNHEGEEQHADQHEQQVELPDPNKSGTITALVESYNTRAMCALGIIDTKDVLQQEQANMQLPEIPENQIDQAVHDFESLVANDFD